MTSIKVYTDPSLYGTTTAPTGRMVRNNDKSNLLNIQKPKIDNTYTFTVGQSAFSYVFTGSDRNGSKSSESDPTININDTDVLVLNIVANSPVKKLFISTSSTTGIAPKNHTLLNNDIASGTLKWYPGAGNTGTFHYLCESDNNFFGNIVVSAGNSGNMNLTSTRIIPSSSNLSAGNDIFYNAIPVTNVTDLRYTWSLSGSTGNASGVAYDSKYRLETTNNTGLGGQTETLYVNVNVASSGANTGVTNSGIVLLSHSFVGTVPLQIGSLSFSSGNTGQIDLSWSAPSDGGNTISDYIIQVGSGLKPFVTYADGVSTATTGSVTGLVNGDQYFFQVAAINALGTGAFSVSGSAIPAAVPTQIGTLSFTTGNAQFSLAWSAPASNNGSLITDYIIQYSGQNGGVSPITFSDGVSTARSGTITGLVNGSCYFARVAAINSIGTGLFSTLQGPVTPSSG